LISGATMLDFIVAPVPAATKAACALGFWGLVLALLAAGLPGLIRQRRWDRLALLAGLGASIVGLYVVGGPEVIRPHHERYGMGLFVPTILLMSALLSSLISRFGSERQTIARLSCLAMVAAGCWGTLLVFKVAYLDTLRATGGGSHPTFRTAAVEPKQAAFDIIVDDLMWSETASAKGAVSPKAGKAPAAPAPERVATTVLAEDWWLYWPIRFLACRNPGIEVIPFEELFAQSHSSMRVNDRDMSTLSTGGYAVGFAGGELEQAVVSGFSPNQLRRWDIADDAGRKLITVFRVRAKQ
jgi:hypothetical protein